jgi:hypothetical protein
MVGVIMFMVLIAAIALAMGIASAAVSIKNNVIDWSKMGPSILLIYMGIMMSGLAFIVLSAES